MAAKNGDGLKWAPTLKKVFKESEAWWANRVIKNNELDRRLDKLWSDLAGLGPFTPVSGSLSGLGLFYSMQCCVPATMADARVLSEALYAAIAFRNLDFRRAASLSLPYDYQPARPFRASMEAAGPAMLLQWDAVEVSARLLIDVAEKDLRFKTVSGGGWRRGTNDAFLIFLFAEVFGISMSYRPDGEIVPEYCHLLDHWRTTDAEQFAGVMAAAAEFHIRQSKDSTQKHTYEFEDYFDRVYPAELLAVQALRVREGLPAFETGHPLIDTPWSLLRDLPSVPPYSLAVEAEARFQKDYPEFR